MRKNATLLSRPEIASIRAPIESASTLPARAFTSREFFDAEIERIFRRNWMGLCYAHTLAQPGDIRPMQLFGMPLVAVRGDDGRVRVFHNICPYDGCPAVLSAESAATRIEVLYHGWRYDLRGRLTHVPYWNGDPDATAAAIGKRDGNLVEVRSETRLDVVFIDLGGRAGSIDIYLKPLIAALSEYDLGATQPVEDDDGHIARLGRTLKTNWKSYLENAAINVLHEAFAHEAYRRSPEVPRVKDGKKTYFTLTKGRLLALGYDLADFARTYDTGAVMHFGRAPGRPPRQGFFVTYYPNLVLPVRFNMLRINICLPEAPDLTRILHCGYFAPAAVAHADFPAYHARVVKNYRTVYAEDGRILEAVQAARSSPVWQQHFYAPFWDDQHYHFNNLVLDDLVGRRRTRRQ